MGEEGRVPDEEVSPPREEGERRDLRYTSHEGANVRVERELDGSGHLARGDRTRMSVLNFSSRHVARTERDPDFAFRPPPTPKPPEAPVVAPVAEPVAAAGEATMLDRVRKLFGF